MAERLPRVNVKLLDATMAEVRKAARRKTGQVWDQNHWRAPLGDSTGECGTAMCFAGWAAQLDGGRWLSWREEWAWLRARKGETPEVVTPDGQPLVHVRERAERRLGLTEQEASELFSVRNTLSDLSRLVRDIKSGKTRQPGYWEARRDV